jgi:hypothetical protein
MKAKLKLDGKTIRDFFVQHAEKIIFAGIVVCFALIVYRAAARETFPKGPGNQNVTPDKLAGLAADAKRHWQDTVPDATDLKTPDYPAIVGRKQIAVEERPYALDKPFDSPLFPQRPQRGEPPLYPVEALQGKADCGRIATVRLMEDGAASLPAGGGGVPRSMPAMQRGEAVQGERWVVLTGLVSVEKQYREFYDYYKNAQKQTPNDVPVYAGYYVQRLEVSGADAGELPDWSKSQTIISGQAMTEATSNWAQMGRVSQEVVDPRYLDQGQRLAFPLPPLVDRQWDESVVHPPQIPLFRQQYEQPLEMVPTTPEGQPLENPFAVPDQGRPFAAPAPGYNTPRGHVPSRTEYDGPVSSGRFQYGSGSGVSGYYSPRGHGPMGYYPGPGYRGPRAAPPLSGQANQLPKYQLFRFFDFKVEPGKQYRYRVRLVLRNPNADVEDRYLSEEVLAKKKQIEDTAEKLKAEGKVNEANLIRLTQWGMINTDWSEPTEVISVPRDSRLLAISVQAPPRAAAEPSAKVMVISWVKDQGIEAFTEKTVDRGKVVNYAGCHFPETPQPKKPSKKEAGGLPISSPPQPFAGGANEPVEVDYLTDTLVLDIHGGQLLPGKDRLNCPGKILLLDPDGTLTVRAELDDLAEYNKFRERAQLLERREGGPGAEGYGPQPGYEGYPRRPGYDGYQRRPGYDGYQQGRGGGNLDMLRGGGSNYGPVRRPGGNNPRSPQSRRGGSS